MGRLIESLPIRLLSVIREVGVVVTILLLTRLPLVEYGDVWAHILSGHVVGVV